MNSVIYLFVAIIFETGATSLLNISDGFSKPLPAIASLLLYLASIYCLSNCLKSIPVGIAYAIWSALGIVLVTSVGIVAFKQTPDWAAIIGFLLIIAGVIVLNLFSKMGVQ
ncbi:MAG: multidrug efflux SMR transporter [Methanosphaera sp.]|nr:multidrug efflux SMR transporter [Methanosphaera sp.]